MREHSWRSDRRKTAERGYGGRWQRERVAFLTLNPVCERCEKEGRIANLVAEQMVEELLVDVAFIADFIAACESVGLSVWRYEGPGKPEGRGLKIVAHAQGKKVMFEDRQLCMPHSITRTEDRILEERVIIDASPVTYSCAANAAIDSDGQGNRAFDKTRSRGRIDGMVTTAMSIGGATAHEKPKKKSVYASRGIRRV